MRNEYKVLVMLVGMITGCGGSEFTLTSTATATETVSQSTHVLSEGPAEVGKVTIKGIDYYLVVNKVIDVDPSKPLYAVYVTRGSWQVAKPSIIADPGHILQSADDIKNDPKAYLKSVISAINVDLERRFIPSPIPHTWEETVEVELQLLKLKEVDGKVVLE